MYQHSSPRTVVLTLRFEIRVDDKMQIVETRHLCILTDGRTMVCFFFFFLSIFFSTKIFIFSNKDFISDGCPTASYSLKCRQRDSKSR